MKRNRHRRFLFVQQPDFSERTYFYSRFFLIKPELNVSRVVCVLTWTKHNTFVFSEFIKSKNVSEKKHCFKLDRNPVYLVSVYVFKSGNYSRYFTYFSRIFFQFLNSCFSSLSFFPCYVNIPWTKFDNLKLLSQQFFSSLFWIFQTWFDEGK